MERHLERRHGHRAKQRTAVTAMRVAAIAGAIAACSGDAKDSMPKPLPWKHGGGAWDDAKWGAACGGERSADKHGVIWFGSMAKGRNGWERETSACAVVLREDGSLLLVSIEVQGSEQSIVALLPPRVDALCSEVPENVCTEVRAMAYVDGLIDSRQVSVGGLVVRRTFDVGRGGTEWRLQIEVANW